jgi:hypothetical protein
VGGTSIVGVGQASFGSWLIQKALTWLTNKRTRGVAQILPRVLYFFGLCMVNCLASVSRYCHLPRAIHQRHQQDELVICFTGYIAFVFVGDLWLLCNYLASLLDAHGAASQLPTMNRIEFQFLGTELSSNKDRPCFAIKYFSFPLVMCLVSSIGFLLCPQTGLLVVVAELVMVLI